MFSDSGSTAIINGSPVKVGQTMRGEGAGDSGTGNSGTGNSGTISEAVVKRIDRNCVEVEINGERYLLRI